MFKPDKLKNENGSELELSVEETKETEKLGANIEKLKKQVSLFGGVKEYAKRLYQYYLSEEENAPDVKVAGVAILAAVAVVEYYLQKKGISFQEQFENVKAIVGNLKEAKEDSIAGLAAGLSLILGAGGLFVLGTNVEAESRKDRIAEGIKENK